MIENSYYKEKVCKKSCELCESKDCLKDFERNVDKKMKLESLKCQNYKRNVKEI